ncbi:YjeF protein, function unknown [Cronobacter universalis NCTC 9529]|nr:YjeF protein, function unknown [Cronobacter universalis NCTC 9529]
MLSGIIGALLAQGLNRDALAQRFGTRGMLATDLFSTLYRFVNPDIDTDQNHD